MSLVGTILAASMDATAVVLLCWTTWTAVRFRERPSAWPFVALVGLLALWAVFALGSEIPVVSTVSPLSTVVDFGQIGAGLFIPGAWVVYALVYAGRGPGLTWRRIAMLGGIALPLVGSGLVIASRPGQEAAERMIAPLIGVEILYLVTLVLYGTYLMVGVARRHARVSNLQIAVVIAGVWAPYLGGAIRNGGNPPADGATIGLVAAGILLGVATHRYPVMTGFPKADYVARTRVVEALQEAVVVLDYEDHVLDVNGTTAELFDQSPAAMIGEPVRSVVDGLGDTDLAAGTTGTVRLRTTEGRRQFQFSVSTVDGTGAEAGDGAVARAVLFRDVTDERTREQRLTVLNRVLRHNVRNELDIVLAYAERIDDEAVRNTVRESATDLVDLSEKARDAEEVMTTSTRSPEPVDLADVAATVADRYRNPGSDGELTVEAPGELVVRSHRQVIERALSELVDNALTHAGDSPNVEIAVREAPGGGVDLSVTDDGPGIPERERRILTGGGETQLEHGRGIGLWLVNWAVIQLGGDLEFGENEPRGSVVTLRLYGAGNGS
jgi:signal transduction histidine kinase